MSDPQVVLLSPGIFNSAYFEHVFLAREMGVPLVEGRDLVVEDDRVFMRTTAGLAPVHTIYRRINDDFLDPDAFRPDSLLGVRGLIEAWRRGNVSLANAVGTGVADDKAVYAYMPRIIRYYLGEDAILPNVETHICGEPDGLAYTLDASARAGGEAGGESGGYGIIIGPHASKAELDEFRDQLLADPANYISQPMVKLSVSPTLCDDGVQPRHVDLRPFAVTGRDTWVLPGGLTRVALRAGSLVVNSSQGGGSKDTWVLAMSETRRSAPAPARSPRRQCAVARALHGAHREPRAPARRHQDLRARRRGRAQLAVAAAHQRRRRAAFFAKHAAPDATSVAHFYLLDADNPTSVQSAIRAARENARTLRALISTEMWLQINVFHSRIRALSATRPGAGATVRVCAMLKEGVQTHTGITEGTFYRDQGWYFYMLGRHRARRPDHAAARHQVQRAVAAGRGGCGDRRGRMERAAARGGRLPRLSPRVSAWLCAARGRRLPAAEYGIPAFGRAEPGAARLASDQPCAAAIICAAARRRWGDWTTSGRCWRARRWRIFWDAGSHRSSIGCSVRLRALHEDIVTQLCGG